jgi:RHS repeat-associated protein
VNYNWELTRCTEKSDGNKTVAHNYEYDKVGNRTVYERLENGVTKERYKYEYNDANQLVKRKNTRIWGDPGTTYKYDGDGNLVQEQDCTNNADPVKYEYTAENRLAVVSQGGTILMAAMYDGDNNRVFQIDNTYKWEDCYGDDVLIPNSERTENGDSPQEELASLVKGGANAKGYTLTEYVNDVNRENTEVLSEYKADNTMRQAYTYGESGNGERVGVDKVDKSTETSYYVYDGRGSVTGLVTDDGKLTNSYTYDPYGTLTSGTVDAVNYYGYNAESTNTKTGLQYLRARYYDPENGNFTSEDTEDGELPFPLTRNRYAYALNNPLNYKDPTGHKSKAVGKAVSGAAGGVMGSIWGGTKTVKKVDKPVKNIASAPRRSIQRETGNASGVASGRSKGGSGRKSSSSSGNDKAAGMAFGNMGAFTKMAGMTGNQRPGFMTQLAWVLREQSNRMICTPGQMRASSDSSTMSSPYIMPDAEYYVGSDEVREAAGDIVEMVVGIAMAVIGAIGTGSSMAFTFATVGGGAPIAIPVATVSEGIFWTGVVMTWDAILSMAGKIKGNGGGQKGSPKKDSDHMVGENGTQVTSKTTWQNGKTERLDVENPAPGERDGQIHYHDANNKKYMYDFQRNVFYDEETKILAPKSVQKLLEDKKFQKGMEQALKILGEI